MRATLPHLSATDSIDDICDVLQETGAVVLDGSLERPVVDAIRPEIEAPFAGTPSCTISSSVPRETSRSVTVMCKV